MSTSKSIQVLRTARYYTLGEPTPVVRDVWFVCHGYGQSAAAFVEEFQQIVDPSRLIVAPEALSRFYATDNTEFHGSDVPVVASWMTREDREHEIADYVAYLDAVYTEIFSVLNRESATVTVLGFSQGGATANRWVTQGKVKADRLIMWGSLLATDSDLNQATHFFRDVPLTLVYGTRDEFADSGMIANYEKLLAANNIPYSLRTFAGGHRMD